MRLGPVAVGDVHQRGAHAAQRPVRASHREVVDQPVVRRRRPDRAGRSCSSRPRIGVWVLEHPPQQRLDELDPGRPAPPREADRPRCSSAGSAVGRGHGLVDQLEAQLRVDQGEPDGEPVRKLSSRRARPASWPSAASRSLTSANVATSSTTAGPRPRDGHEVGAHVAPLAGWGRATRRRVVLAGPGRRLPGCGSARRSAPAPRDARRRASPPARGAAILAGERGPADDLRRRGTRRARDGSRCGRRVGGQPVPLLLERWPAPTPRLAGLGQAVHAHRRRRADGQRPNGRPTRSGTSAGRDRRRGSVSNTNPTTAADGAGAHGQPAPGETRRTPSSASTGVGRLPARLGRSIHDRLAVGEGSASGKVARAGEGSAARAASG